MVLHLIRIVAKTPSRGFNGNDRLTAIDYTLEFTESTKLVCSTKALDSFDKVRSFLRRGSSSAGRSVWYFNRFF